MRLVLLGLVLLITATPAGAVSPGVRRDLIVFVREDPRAPGPNLGVDLWLVDTGGGRPRRLVGDKGSDEGPAWSPDGTLVAFHKTLFAPGDPDAFRSLDVWTVRENGRGRRNLTRDGSAAGAAWSPDGRKLAFGRGNGIFVIRRDGSGKVHVARRNDPGGPAWSPDGRRLAFSPPGELRVVGANGSRERLLARGAVSGTSVSWSPDGRWIAHAVAHEGQDSVALVPARGGRPRVVGRGFVDAAWSPSGGRLALVREGTRREAGIFLAGPRGESPRRLTRGFDTQPTWSRDGRSLAFRRGELIGDVFVVNVTGGGLRNLTRTPRLDEREPAWRRR